MGPESSSAPAPSSATASTSISTSTSTPSPCVKRGRDPEDEVYIDNLHSHKRYLSEVCSSNLQKLRFLPSFLTLYYPHVIIFHFPDMEFSISEIFLFLFLFQILTGYDGI